jgi:hypothetical protein
MRKQLSEESIPDSQDSDIYETRERASSCAEKGRHR